MVEKFCIIADVAEFPYDETNENVDISTKNIKAIFFFLEFKILIYIILTLIN